jgi:hypothetical protein
VEKCTLVPKKSPLRVAMPEERKHLTAHAAGGNLLRPEKAPQFRHIGESTQHNVDHYDRVDGGLLSFQP